MIIRADSRRNVSRGNRVGWAIFRGRAYLGVRPHKAVSRSRPSLRRRRALARSEVRVGERWEVTAVGRVGKR